ncbi:hypothetical protein OK074_6846 [Actinobacteria bacterium OK074]|nr:hypothetical protein OK074_6846 [Actinobacteria bacterium OK074]
MPEPEDVEFAPEDVEFVSNDGGGGGSSYVQRGNGQMFIAKYIDTVNVHPAPTEPPREKPPEDPPAKADEPPQSELAKTADKLAELVRKRWEDDERRRNIQDPHPLAVHWTTPRDEDLPEHSELVRRPRTETTDTEETEPEAPPAGRLDLTGHLAQIADVYERVPSRRLVVLGKAGSGKTVLGVRFVLDRLKTRRSGAAVPEPVPEIFSLGSWNPKDEDLRTWLVGRLSRDQPGLAAPDADGRTPAEELVDGELILPVLDGFDEIRVGLRSDAREQLSKTPLPYILTSRFDEYEAAVRNTRGMHLAAVVELAALRPDDSAEYLRLSSAKAVAPEWRQVRDEMRAHPDGPLAKALSTPLMVTLAAAVYGEQGTEATTEEEATGATEGTGGSTPENEPHTPRSLLNTTRFPTPAHIESHLLAAFLASAYRERPGDLHRWHPQSAHRWLTHLAEHLHRRKTPDLEWWELGTSMRTGHRTLLIAFLAALSYGVPTAIGNIPVDLVRTSYGLGFALRRGLAVGLLHGLVAGAAFGFIYWLATRSSLLKPAPVRVSLFGGGSRRTGTELWKRSALGALVGFSFALVVVLVDRFPVRWLGLYDGLGGELPWSAVVFPLEIGVAVGLALGVITWLESPVKVKEATSFVGLLRSNRKNVYAHLAVWALAVGLVGGVVESFSNSLLGSVQLSLVFGVEGAFGGGLGYGLSLSAWCQWFVLARLWLPLTRRLPWRLIAFLDDACERGVLRRTGAVYQFRHASLQEHLTKPAPRKGS